MRRMIGFLMMVGLVVGVVGCGNDDNPVKSNQELFVGTWFVDGDFSVSFRSDGTWLDDDGDSGTWSLVGDQLTIGESGSIDTLVVTISFTDTEATLTRENGEVIIWMRKT